MESMTFRELTDKMMLLYTEGKFADALQLVEQNADRFPEQSARTTFWKMCLLSLSHRPDDVMSIFRQALDSGLWWAENQFLDTDLDAVRDLPEFKRLIEESNRKCMEMRASMKPDRTVLVPENPSEELPLLIGLHGRNGHNDSNLEQWEVARQRGWLVLSPQSRQALSPDSYCWDNSEQGLEDVLFHFEEITKTYSIDRNRIIIAGFSQGGGMAIYTALKGNLAIRGFLAVSAWWQDANMFDCERKGLRGYFVLGEKDNTLERAREIQDMLRKNNIQFDEEVHADMGHEFPASFGTSFEKALEFIFEEHE